MTNIHVDCSNSSNSNRHIYDMNVSVNYEIHCCLVNTSVNYVKIV